MEKLLLALSIVIILLCVVIIFVLLKILKKPASQESSDSKEIIDEIKKEILNLKLELDSKLSTLKNDLNSSISLYLDTYKTSTNENLSNLSANLKENLMLVNSSVKENTEKIEKYLDTIRATLAQSIEKLQKDNNDKLEQMRRTVDEKLDATLNTRLSESFKLVQENLSKVELGLGEMKSLASNVGDLKKVLSNVKQRGVWGEMQLSQILSEILTKDQYEENVVTRPKSNLPVEFAVKLPGSDDSIVRLPIDSKFPLDTYNGLLDAYDSMDKEQIEKNQNALKKAIRAFAKDIKDKYVEVPYTVDFGIMFLPIEGLYAEVAKLGLIDELQTTYRIIIAGPTTMAALLNSLQVGFRTLAIQKRSSEVWNILGAVKSEFNNFGNVLKKAQDKIREADDEIEKLVTTRTNKIQSKLKTVAELDYSKSQELLDAPEE